MATHTVKRGEWLAKIAADHGFLDGGAAIWDANPELQQKSGGNPDVLQEGWEIAVPELSVKTVKVSAGRTAHVRMRTCALGLRVLLRDQAGAAVAGWKFTASASGMAELKGESTGSGEITIPKLPPGTKTVTIEVQESKAFGAWKFSPEKITLHVGDLDPVQGDAAFATMAVKKLLINLGYKPGALNAETSPEFRAAVAAFQADAGLHPPHGLADQKTCDALVQHSNVHVGRPAAPENSPEPDRNSPLTGAPLASVVSETVTTFSQYVDPTDPDQTNEQALKRFHFFPAEAYVAPSDPERNRWNANVLRMPGRKFVFLDAGGWLGDVGQREFGVLWGRHVYLCRYHANGKAAAIAFKRSSGLDREFFAAHAGYVEILTYASASWASSQDFDWSKVVLVIPDLHLMTKPTADVWFTTNYQFQAEKDLLQFAQQVLDFDAGSGKLRVVQLGDSYDLWVNCTPCLFQANETRKVELVEPKGTSVQKLAAWVHEIQAAGATGGMKHGPAQNALGMLESELGADRGMVYLYGNHDNYLILPEVCAAAGIPNRRKWWDCPGVFIEHAHRMEARFLGPVDLVPHNYDGDQSGYNATISAYNTMSTGGAIKKAAGSAAKVIANKWAGFRDQKSYWGELAQVWLGRQAAAGSLKPPHVCVIGHTHMPKLVTIDIDAYRRPV